MIDKDGYIKAKLKSQDQIARVHPPASYWGTNRYMCPTANDLLLPYLGRFVWVKMARIDMFRFTYILKHTCGLHVEPNWIAYFDSEELVPEDKWKHESIIPEERFLIFDGLVIITR